MTARPALLGDLADDAEVARFSAIFGAAPVGASIVGPLDGRMHHANPRLAEILGLTVRELCASDWRSLTHPDDRERIGALMAHLAAGSGDASFRTDVRAIRADGTTAWLSMSVSRIGAMFGGDRSLCIVQDITDRKGTLEAMEAARFELAEAQRVARLGSWTWNVRTGERHFSAEAFRLLGLMPDGREAPTEPELASAFGAAQLASFDAAIEAHAAAGTILETEVVVTLPTGDLRHLRIHVEPARDATGAVTVMRGVGIDVTSERQAASALSESEARYRLMAESASDVVALHDNTGVFQWVSPSVVNATGWQPEDLIGREVLELIHPDDLPAVGEARERMHRTGGTRIEERVRCADGSYRWFAISLRSVQDADGAVIGRMAGWQDIGGIVEAREALRESEERLRRTVEGIDAMVTYRASSTAPLSVSPQVERILGYRPDEVADLTIWNGLVHPDDLPRLLPTWEGTANEWVLEYRMRHRDGHWVWMNDHGRGTRLADGTQDAVWGVTVDVTERRRAEQRLHDSEAQLREAQRLAGVGSWSWDLTTDGWSWSEEAFRISGLEPRETPLTQEERLAIHGPEVVAKTRALSSRTIETGEPYELEYDLTRPDGTVRHVIGRAEAIQSDDGAIVGLRGTLADVTEQHMAQEARARRIARRADYLARVEHTLRTNLSVVEGWTEILAERDETMDPGQRRAAITAIERNARSLMHHVRGVMTAAVETSRADAIVTVPVELGRAVRTIVEEYVGLPLVGSIGASGPDGLRCLGTAEELDTILRHLVENATRHAGPDGATEVEWREGSTGHVELVVRDDGPGLPTDVDVFTPFVSSGSGHGLGLYVVRTLVDALGGEIVGGRRADGRRGAEFVVTLRAA